MHKEEQTSDVLMKASFRLLATDRGLKNVLRSACGSHYLRHGVGDLACIVCVANYATVERCGFL